MDWTTTRPMKPGWYWWREKKDGKVARMLVQEIEEAHIQMGSFYGEWAGPLEPPTEAAREEGHERVGGLH